MIIMMKEGYVLFNDALNTFYLRLYGVRHIVKDQSDSERESIPAASTWATLSDLFIYLTTHPTYFSQRLFRHRIHGYEK